jgi:exopolysaccharide biosynthesis polyprenyl glycosylphosphotransferase
MRNAEEIYSAERQFPELFEQELPFSSLSVNDGAVAAKTSRQRSLKRTAAQEWTVAVLYALLDVTAWIILYGIITYVRGDTFYETRMGFLLIDLLQLVVIMQALYIIGGYDRNVDKRTLSYAVEHILAVAAAAVFSAMLIYSAATFDQTMRPSRAVLLLSFLSFLAVSLSYRRWIGKHVAATIANRAFLVIGSGERAAQFYRSYKHSPNRQLLHFVDTTVERIGKPIAGEGSPIIEGGVAARLQNLSERYSGIILAKGVKELDTRLLEKLVRTQFQRTRVYTLESFYETHWRYVPLEAIDPVWPLQTGFQLAQISPYYYLKRLCDIAFACVALAICAPLMAIVALIVWLGSGRPVLFSQSRVGRENSIFTIHKFRTMVSRGGPNLDDIYTREGDPRITRVGRWLRKLRLDELPQFWNVVKGDMSLIGPRAEWDKCVECYEKKIPFYHFRHLVKPGITGWAQVNYPYGESDADAIEKLKYDLYYIRHYSLKLDAMIALKTVHVMLFSKGR